VIGVYFATNNGDVYVCGTTGIEYQYLSLYEIGEHALSRHRIDANHDQVVTSCLLAIVPIH